MCEFKFLCYPHSLTFGKPLPLASPPTVAWGDDIFPGRSGLSPPAAALSGRTSQCQLYPRCPTQGLAQGGLSERLCLSLGGYFQEL